MMNLVTAVKHYVSREWKDLEQKHVVSIYRKIKSYNNFTVYGLECWAP
jgi:hypothetical protein